MSLICLIVIYELPLFISWLEGYNQAIISIIFMLRIMKYFCSYLTSQYFLNLLWTIYITFQNKEHCKNIWNEYAKIFTLDISGIKDELYFLYLSYCNFN